MSFAEMSIDEAPDDEPLVTGFSGFTLSDQDVRNRQLQYHRPLQQQQPFDDLTSEFSNLRTSETQDPDEMDIDDPMDLLDLQSVNLSRMNPEFLPPVSTPIKAGKRRTSSVSVAAAAPNSPWKISSVFNPTELGAQFAVKEIEKNEDVDMSMVLYSPVNEGKPLDQADDIDPDLRPDAKHGDFSPQSAQAAVHTPAPTLHTSEAQSPGQDQSAEYHLHLPNPTLGWMIQNPNLPYIITSYLQLAFNGIMLAVMAYVVYLFISSVRQDVGFKFSAHSGEILMAKSKCAKLYLLNECAANSRRPALETLCDQWELCMNRDEHAVNRARLGAETLAEIITGFIDRFSYKALGLISLLFLGSMFVSNFAFGFFRAKTYYNGEVEKQNGLWDKARYTWGGRKEDEPKRLVFGQQNVLQN
ncbi:Di-sulfide bridge nucleocytoplasmic transport domain-domain-containing protein [Yarrowia lipolytica]|uniref:Di-sulfide bridge nucleocytoplasmic transport domain-domain-containing protein n=1 Tax=Yarrowia lipolytica TaxID=4952 RepID=A0A371CFF3_YARLL|nr:Di-sulfide bridge nucleocytoplasmic transport domain-domain-containing protein [Yarrowia lipolytica]RDW33868.1 Di-sulfide bridge nucleocytoplasmic transport domain-domain-containing protein [Yarrowia lipolytica]RDW40033.1 Di-sulfide bridge nucleocytoplasmic transport domain-domain-containing protein [Yarrowia lipolytica]RDW48880.1 Di-sulfide bridge nucleocytoplasmic transport domain-domain-containing protein [Yarrowia lipolytica]RDW55751.1 Di-sulfide bridge nucleocytoplasmic transport domain